MAVITAAITMWRLIVSAVNRKRRLITADGEVISKQLKPEAVSNELQLSR